MPADTNLRNLHTPTITRPTIDTPNIISHPIQIRGKYGDTGQAEKPKGGDTVKDNAAIRLKSEILLVVKVELVG